MRIIAITLICLAVLYGLLAIVMSAREFGESVKKEQQEKIERYESMLHRECAAMWPLKGENYRSCKGEV